MKNHYLTLACCCALGTAASTQTVQKCCGTGNSTFLLGNLSTASHSQVLYTPDDLTGEAPGDITILYFRYGTTGIASGNTLTDLLVRLTQTAQTAFSGGDTFFTGVQPVMNANFTIPPGVTGDWFAIPLDIPFAYDETLTLVVDISFLGSTTTNFGTMSSSMAGRKLYWDDRISTTGEHVVSSWQDIGFDLAPSTGIAEQNDASFMIYPNPATDHIEFLSNHTLSGTAELRMVDASGRIVLERTIAAGEASGLIATGGLSDGLYQLRLITPDGATSSRRLVIAR